MLAELNVVSPVLIDHDINQYQKSITVLSNAPKTISGIIIGKRL